MRAKELHAETIPTVIVADDFPNFSICGLPYYISHEVADWRNLAHRTVQQIENAGIRLLLGRTVTAVDVVAKQVTIVDESGTTTYLEYDKLIMATGALSLKPHIGGLDNPGVLLV